MKKNENFAEFWNVTFCQGKSKVSEEFVIKTKFNRKAKPVVVTELIDSTFLLFMFLLQQLCLMGWVFLVKLNGKNLKTF